MVVNVYSKVVSFVSRWSLNRMRYRIPKRIRCSRISRLLYMLLLFIILVYTLVAQLRFNTPLPAETHETQGNEIRTNTRENSRAVNPHKYHIIMSNPRLCEPTTKKMNLLVLVTSSAENLDRRKAIRDTWGNKGRLNPDGVRILFLLANPHDLGIQREVVEEYRSHGDVMQEDFLESYMNLTLKTIMGIKWASSHCQNVKYVMKTDDDIFVNIDLLINFLRPLEGYRIFTGCIKQKKSFQPVNSIPGLELPRAHPLFVAGAGYIFSGSLLKELYEASLKERIIPIEDVYVSAHLAKRIGAHPPIHDDRFSCGEMVIRECDLAKTFTGHKITPDRMRTIWKTLEGNIC